MANKKNKKLNKALKDVLNKPVDEATIEITGTGATAGVPETSYDYSVSDEASSTSRYHRRSPAFNEYPDYDEQLEPMDKIMVAIQHHLINGDYDKASELVKQYRGSGKEGEFFSAHHMNQLIDWVRNIYKYTNMTDLNKNYYNYDSKGRMDNANELKKTSIKDEKVDQFMKDVEKVLRRKLQMK